MRVLLTCLALAATAVSFAPSATAAVPDYCAEGGMFDVDRDCDYWAGGRCRLYVHSEPTGAVVHGVCIGSTE